MYYSTISDTTPDNAHTEQVLQIVRFAEIQSDSVEIMEAFTDFTPLDVKTAKIITAEITNKLEQDGLNLEDCRGQFYDNKAIMAGVHSGVQKRILDLNSMAVFIPSNDHSLSLVGVHAAHANVQAQAFFGAVERLFGFLSCSAHWQSV
jgi:hypothetical protein